MEESYEKISPTAKFVAHIRTFTDIPFAKEIAAESGAEKDFKALAGQSAESINKFIPIWEARYKSTDKIIIQRNITQVLEIAAGLSPRGLAMTENLKVVYVTTDLPQILEEEKTIAEAIFKKLDIHRSNLHFQAANALDLGELLQAATPFTPDKSIAVITEGLLPYLTREEKETLASNIRELLKKYQGLWVTSIEHTEQSRKTIYETDEKNMRQRMRNISSATERNIENNVFANENDIREFFTNAGFTIEEYPHSNVLDDLSSIKLMKLNRDETLRILQVAKTLILTPQND